MIFSGIRLTKVLNGEALNEAFKINNTELTFVSLNVQQNYAGETSENNSLSFAFSGTV